MPGVPAPQGSKTRGAHGGLYESSKAVGPWRERVGLAAAQTLGNVADWYDEAAEPTREAVSVNVRFIFTRPKSHLRKDGTTRPAAPRFPATRPDVDKLVRAVLDALTGVAFVDDSQVVAVNALKEYGNVSGADIRWDVLHSRA